MVCHVLGIIKLARSVILTTLGPNIRKLAVIGTGPNSHQVLPVWPDHAEMVIDIHNGANIPNGNPTTGKLQHLRVLSIEQIDITYTCLRQILEMGVLTG